MGTFEGLERGLARPFRRGRATIASQQCPQPGPLRRAGEGTPIPVIAAGIPVSLAPHAGSPEPARLNRNRILDRPSSGGLSSALSGRGSFGASRSRLAGRGEMHCRRSRPQPPLSPPPLRGGVGVGVAGIGRERRDRSGHFFRRQPPSPRPPPWPSPQGGGKERVAGNAGVPAPPLPEEGAAVRLGRPKPQPSPLPRSGGGKGRGFPPGWFRTSYSTRAGRSEPCKPPPRPSPAPRERGRQSPMRGYPPDNAPAFGPRPEGGSTTRSRFGAGVASASAEAGSPAETKCIVGDHHRSRHFPLPLAGRGRGGGRRRWPGAAGQKRALLSKAAPVPATPTLALPARGREKARRRQRRCTGAPRRKPADPASRARRRVGALPLREGRKCNALSGRG